MQEVNKLTRNNSSSLSSFKASVRIVLYSAAVKLVPPPLGKSVSSGLDSEAARVFSSSFEVFARLSLVDGFDELSERLFLPSDLSSTML
jgi:hypothetical protein